ncbi:hypothetical protein PB2503_05097 [Parvularcula bermudensis HTCC2503]|uniref:Lipoprotein n=1 Tax=Parvularcula bermudensis (strain ATCC BAA-594 / HTCC2503 / KCTC 12087) TaxID=314260 RepID=E0TFS9_PARBH|nr:hypothetical protein [Parvularcula bermudensis]ADM09094.1 hypothetical protein PB2503_05097 [Parvularcula bermudensis HTCC2503]
MSVSPRIGLLIAVSGLALAACGKDDPSSDTGAAGAAIEALGPSPLDSPFVLEDAEPIDLAALLNSAEGIAYDEVTFDQEIGAMVVTNYRPVTDSEFVQFVIGRMEVYGLDPELFARIEAGEPVDETRELFSKVRAFDIESHQTYGAPLYGGEDTSSDEADDPAALANSLTLTMDALELGQVTVGPAAETTATGEQAEYAFELDGLYVKEAAIEMTSKPDDFAFTMTIPDGRIGSYRGGAFGGMSFIGMSYSLKQDQAAVQTSLQSAGIVGRFFEDPFLRRLFLPGEQMTTVELLEWDGLSADNLLPYLKRNEDPPASETDLLSVGGLRGWGIEGFVEGQKAYSVDRVVVEPIDFVHLMPKKIAFETEGGMTYLTAYAEPGTEMATFLEDNELSAVPTENRMAFSYMPDQRRLRLDTTAAIDGIYAVDIALEMTDFDHRQIFGTEGDVQKSAVLDSALKELAVEIKDEHLLDLMALIGANVTQQEPDALRRQASGLLALVAVQGAQVSPRIQTYAQALSTFLAEGGTLSIAMRPEAPVPLSALGGQTPPAPATLLETYNLTVEREAAE